MQRFWLMQIHPKSQPMVRLDAPYSWGGLNADIPRKLFTIEEVNDEIQLWMQCQNQLGLYRYVKALVG